MKVNKVYPKCPRSNIKQFNFQVEKQLQKRMYANQFNEVFIRYKNVGNFTFEVILLNLIFKREDIRKINCSRKNNKLQQLIEKLKKNSQGQTSYNQIYFNMLDTTSKKKLNKPLSAEKNSNSHLQQKIFYQCFCARNYLSYSALYLHVKNKHQQNLSFKSFCRKRTHWSGSVKICILEFDEEAGEQRKMQPLSLKLRKRKKKMSLKQSDSQAQLNGKNNQNVKIEDGHDEVDEGRSILNIFQLYWRTGEGNETRNFRKELLSNLVNFIQRNHANIFPPLGHHQTNFCQKNTCEYVPLILNYFIDEEYQNSSKKQRIISELKKFSDWLFENSFTSQIVVKTEEFPVLPVCKEEKAGDVKIEQVQI